MFVSDEFWQLPGWSDIQVLDSHLSPIHTFFLFFCKIHNYWVSFKVRHDQNKRWYSIRSCVFITFLFCWSCFLTDLCIYFIFLFIYLPIQCCTCSRLYWLSWGVLNILHATHTWLEAHLQACWWQVRERAEIWPAGNGYHHKHFIKPPAQHDMQYTVPCSFYYFFLIVHPLITPSHP